MSKYCARDVKICSSETFLEKHDKECLEQGTILVVCHKCEQRFTNFAKMRHNDVCHEKQEFDCPACGMVLNTADAVQSHYNREHKMEAVLSGEMCYH